MPDYQEEPGSFRDRTGRVVYAGDSVYRTLAPEAMERWRRLEKTRFFRQLTDQGKLIETSEADIDPARFGDQWAVVLEHQRLPFISYPYEWSFSMLKDAALLQLDLLLAALEEDMILKDASAYNVQWRGSQPVFIDIASYQELSPGEAWAGYRQFCQLFLYPLFLQAYRNLPFHPWLRGSIDGIEPEECNAVMSFRDLFRPGVFTHVFLQSRLQKRYGSRDKDVRSELGKAGFHKELIRANAGKLRRIIEGLSWQQQVSTWSDYAGDNTYSSSDQENKQAFVAQAVEEDSPNLVWDLGCNTGVFSRIAAERADYVVAMDADLLAVEHLYQGLKEEGNLKILPLYNNLADPSPALGWRGRERKRLEERQCPDMVFCLALVHHLTISANLPIREFIAWLRSLGSSLVIEFVTKEDPMVQTLLRNKDDQYWDYTTDFFQSCLEEAFEVNRRQVLDSETRILYHARPRS